MTWSVTWLPLHEDCLLFLSEALQWDVVLRGVLSRIQSDHIDQNFASWHQVLSSDPLHVHCLFPSFSDQTIVRVQSTSGRYSGICRLQRKNGINSFCTREFDNRIVFELR